MAGPGILLARRNLHRAAKAITALGGQVPETVEELLTLPGVGRYTAGAVSSLAFGRSAPILDGNVARVLCRLDCIRQDPREPATREVLWARAEQILPRKRVGDFNSAMMELGAMVCTPRSPQCLMCPVRENCEAFDAGLQEAIPARRKAKAVPLVKRWVFCIRCGDRYLVEQRSSRGRWAEMWQFVTIEAGEAVSAELLWSQLSLRVEKFKRIGHVEHRLTHRQYEFEIFACQTKAESDAGARRWATLEELHQLPMSKPQLKAMELVRAASLPESRS